MGQAHPMTFVKTLQIQSPSGARGLGLRHRNQGVGGPIQPTPGGILIVCPGGPRRSSSFLPKAPVPASPPDLAHVPPQPPTHPVLPGVRRPGAHRQEARPLQELPEAGVRGLAPETVSGGRTGSGVGASCALGPPGACHLYPRQPLEVEIVASCFPHGGSGGSERVT